MDQEFFYRLLSCQGVSGRETNIQKTAAAYMEGFADEVRREVNGNVTGILNPDSSFKILLAGHIDEIGLMVTDHTEEGFSAGSQSGGITRGCIWDRRCGLTRERTWYTGQWQVPGNCRKRKNCLIQTLLSTSGPETGRRPEGMCLWGPVWCLIRIGGPCWGNASPQGPG